MDIIECRKCGNLVSSDDGTCGFCGADVPKATPGSQPAYVATYAKRPKPLTYWEKMWGNLSPDNKFRTIGYGILLLAILVLAILRIVSPPYHEPTKTTHHPNVTYKQTCGEDDVQCLGEQYRDRVLPQCMSMIEARSKYAYRWTDGFSNGPVLDREYMTGMPSTVVIYSGRNIELQNGFGAWERMHYQCWFDTAKMSIVHVVLN